MKLSVHTDLAPRFRSLGIQFYLRLVAFPRMAGRGMVWALWHIVLGSRQWRMLHAHYRDLSWLTCTDFGSISEPTECLTVLNAC